MQIHIKSRFNNCIFINMMHSLLENSCSIQFKELNDVTFLCHFISMKDKERVIHGAPWHFEHSLGLIGDVSTTVIPHSIAIHMALFWIQIHNVPLQCMTKSFGQMVGLHLGMSSGGL